MRLSTVEYAIEIDISLCLVRRAFQPVQASRTGWDNLIECPWSRLQQIFIHYEPYTLYHTKTKLKPTSNRHKEDTMTSPIRDLKYDGIRLSVLFPPDHNQLGIPVVNSIVLWLDTPLGNRTPLIILYSESLSSIRFIRFPTGPLADSPSYETFKKKSKTQRDRTANGSSGWSLHQY